MEEKSNAESQEEYTLDGSVDLRKRRAIRAKTGSWFAGILLLVNQGLATLAFYGVGVNLVLFLTRVLGQSNAEAANNVSKWTGTVYSFSLLGAFLSDSYLGRYVTCALFQGIFVIGGNRNVKGVLPQITCAVNNGFIAIESGGDKKRISAGNREKSGGLKGGGREGRRSERKEGLISLSLSSYLFLIKPNGCGDGKTPCGSHSTTQILLFYVSIYLIALGNGGYQPTIATFGADQFDEEHPMESHSKVAFFSYFYLALNFGMLFSNTILGYFENKGVWALGFWASAGSAMLALVLFLVGTPKYRHFVPKGNPFSRFGQVIVAASRKWKVEFPSNDDELYEVHGTDVADNWARNILHTHGFKFLDRAAVKIQTAYAIEGKTNIHNPWHLCSVTQVEEVKCILRLLPIWLCTIIYSVVYTQMTSLFVEQGAAMVTTLGSFNVPPASMSSFEIVSAAAIILIHRRLIEPTLSKFKIRLTELQRMGIGLLFAVMSMVSAGVVEHLRVRQGQLSTSSLSIFWQVPQYVFIGASEVYMLIGQLEFFNGQAPDGLKSFGSALSMTSISLGNFGSCLILTLVTKISSSADRAGWIPRNLNKGHLDRFFYLLAGLTAVDLVIYTVCAKRYNYTRFEERSSRGKNNESST
ncbi:hypothetical protein BUALT_Bualt19G0028600 [Buddleja alternifolia]|uniref:NPF family transporter n=1 Tax=Buddleja alternifolia TaxID=168488 RepID=A0AAV6W1U6_9LAMI|nr:hypothetical protein BUALT_Bualt19G0028600 [Buddleja alternifolia]